jgi:putative ABC transport system permease protein
MPGVSAVGAIHHHQLGGASWYADGEVDGRPEAPGAALPRAGWRIIDGDYFRAMRIPVIAGRAFDTRDRLGAEGVVIINQALARRVWPGENPIGRRMRAGNATRAAGSKTPDWVTVVGVVGDVRHDAPEQPPVPELYRPVAQKSAGAMTIVARTTGDPSRTLALVRDVVRSVDTDVPISELRTLDDIVSGSVARPRLVLWLLGVFAAIGLVLGGVGVYGVVAYTVSRRTQEIGIRVALGAGAGRIGRMVVGQGLRYGIAGVAIGTLAALGVTRAMRGMVFEVTTTDPLTYAAVGGFILLVVGLASWIPARRAGRVQPVVALRDS